MENSRRYTKRWRSATLIILIIMIITGVISSGSLWGSSGATLSVSTLPRLLPPTADPDPVTKVKVSESYGKLPLIFEANQGQTDGQVKFLSRGRGYTLFLTPGEAVMVFGKPLHKDKVGKNSEVEATAIRMQGSEGSVSFPAKVTTSSAMIPASGAPTSLITRRSNTGKFIPALSWSSMGISASWNMTLS